MPDEILFETGEDGIGVLTINRPAARNALNFAAQESFADAVERAAALDNLRALIVTGAGKQSFASGGDMKELQHYPDESGARKLKGVMTLALDRLERLPAPVIGAVNGDAVGGGCEILSACDLRIAGEWTSFRYAQIQVGLTTGWGGTARLVRLLGQSRAMALLLTGNPFSAQEALQMGLVHRLVPQEASVLAAARKWAEELSMLPRNALAAVKDLVRQSAAGQPEAAARVELEQFLRLWPQADHLEAMQAFAEKRAPRFNQHAG
jgi:enoyl-CoA hydratase/carnithine racemase